MERESFESVLNLMSRNFHDREITEAHIDTWFTELGHYDLAVLMAAATDLMKNEAYFPTLYTFEEYLKKALRVDRSSIAALEASFASCTEGCDRGWLYDEATNTVSPCSCSELRQDQKRRYTAHWRKEMIRIGGPELTDYKPVSPDRAKDWMDFIRIREWDKHRELKLGVAGMGDEVDDWIAAGRPGLHLIEAHRTAKGLPPPKKPAFHGNVFNGQSLDDFLETGVSAPNPSPDVIVGRMRDGGISPAAPVPPPARRPGDGDVGGNRDEPAGRQRPLTDQEWRDENF